MSDNTVSFMYGVEVPIGKPTREYVVVLEMAQAYVVIAADPHAALELAVRNHGKAVRRFNVGEITWVDNDLHPLSQNQEEKRVDCWSCGTSVEKDTRCPVCEPCNRGFLGPL